MQVKLIAKTDANLPWLMSYAARTCYEPDEPTGEKVIDLEKRIYNTGHHTVLQHPNFTFYIEGIPIGNITMGLHLNMIFNVSSQRSGRFCFGMFSDPAAIDYITQHIREFYPETTEAQLAQLLAYIKNCLEVYHNKIEAGTRVAAQFIREERPNATDKYIEQNAKKFAQEQLRVLIPVIFPTAVTFTINFSTLTALYRVAWDSVMLYLTEQMAQQVLALDPSLAYAFQRQNHMLETEPKRIIPEPKTIDYRTEPTLVLRSMDDLSTAVYPDYDDLHPVDTLSFAPKFMSNNDIYIKTVVHISLATMGQDQRHRRTNRGPFRFTGDIYYPPIAEELELSDALSKIGWEWVELFDVLHPALVQTLAPYGAMVEYTKSGDLNAVMHEQEKRLCWCTQQEIYELSSQLRQKISNHPGCAKELLTQLSPPCFKCGKCGEGGRYCGRDLRTNPDDFFPLQRKV